MADFGKQLLTILGEIKGSGSFVSSGVESFLFPGLQIGHMDEIGFPINAAQIKDMIKVSHQAPFGKGSKTVLDKTVRSAWEVDADQIKISNKGWDKLIKSIVGKVGISLGLEGLSISANLYKLLIYRKGDFFLAHKDSEKEEGMFGTLIIGLPSKHTGGELVVKFDGRQEMIDFSGLPVNTKYHLLLFMPIVNMKSGLSPRDTAFAWFITSFAIKVGEKFSPNHWGIQSKRWPLF